ncbi:Gfo/Idh/MocA family protein [Ferdinandcohnia quinoae]|uniref:Gfo/Idh/MocA family oxidoreductase n=1 Tax=Fredinandcohnia quinoae TaxID=2918902 RepID=A0AAW5E7K1_9BACI|nr:Gfo/Idh/MocA family oxidoreductase [Fredinandcohnia sp. SECRCQ15]MCH1625585.1 Gfo/Idh/MocA family oxidoreductase [Fredinandcohnia sp. SECRCQ15]
MKKIRVGVIGLGAIGERLIKGFTAHEKTAVMAVVDTNSSRAKEVAGKLGGISWYNNHLEMLEQQALDIVYVAVPPKFHHKIVLDVIEKGIHVLCEKPLANSVSEAREMMERAETAGIIHAMNFPLNYSPEVFTLEKLLKDKYIGDLRRVELTMHFPEWPRPWQRNEWVGEREQGGFVLEVGVHFIQLTNRLFGNITYLHSQLELPENREKCETGVIANLEICDGTPFTINGISKIAGEERIAYTIYGTEGTLSLVNWSQLEGGKLGEKIEPIQAETSGNMTLISSLVHAIEGMPAEIFNFKVGYDAQLVLEKVREN